jgi:glutamyl-tRNA reductase
MAVWALGINHNTAPLDLRGRFAFAIDKIEPHLSGLRQSMPSGPEAAIVSTCNRTEIYCAGDQTHLEHTLDWLAQSGGVSTHALRSHTYSLNDQEAARHAFRVAKEVRSSTD